MASHAAMKALGDDLVAVRRLADALLNTPDVAWTEWELLFLDGLRERRSEHPLSMRQREILVELRDGVTLLTTVDGFSIRHLIRECWLARFELGEDDCAFVERLYADQPAKLRRRTAYRLMALANALDVVPRFSDVG